MEIVRSYNVSFATVSRSQTIKWKQPARLNGLPISRAKQDVDRAPAEFLLLREKQKSFDLRDHVRL